MSSSEVQVLKIRQDTLKTLAEVLEMYQLDLSDPDNGMGNLTFTTNLNKSIHAIVQYTEMGRQNSSFFDQCFNFGEHRISAKEELKRLALCRKFIAFSLHEIESDLALLEQKSQVLKENPYLQSIREIVPVSGVAPEQMVTDSPTKTLYVLQDAAKQDNWNNNLVMPIAIISNTTCTVGSGLRPLSDFETHSKAAYGENQVVFPVGAKGFFYMADSLSNWADALTYKDPDNPNGLEGYDFIVNAEGILQIQDPDTKEYFSLYDMNGEFCARFKELRENFKKKREAYGPKKENLAAQNLYDRCYAEHGRKIRIKRETISILQDFLSICKNKQKNTLTLTQENSLQEMEKLATSFLKSLQNDETMPLHELHQLLLKLYSVAIEFDRVEKSKGREFLFVHKAVEILNLWSAEEFVGSSKKIKDDMLTDGTCTTFYDAEKEMNRSSSVVSIEAMETKKEILTAMLKFRSVVLDINPLHSENNQEKTGLEILVDIIKNLNILSENLTGSELEAFQKKRQILSKEVPFKKLSDEQLLQLCRLAIEYYDDNTSLLDNALQLLQLMASNDLRNMDEYQYLMNWKKVRESVKAFDESSSEDESSDSDDDSDFDAAEAAFNQKVTTVSAYEKLDIAMGAFYTSVQNADFKRVDRQEAYSAANSQLDEILRPNAGPENRVATNASSKLNKFQAKMKKKGSKFEKISSAFGMISGAVMMVAGAAAFLSVALVTVSVAIFTEGLDLFKKSKKEFDEARSAKAMQKPVADLLKAAAAVPKPKLAAAIPVSNEGCKQDNSVNLSAKQPEGIAVDTRPEPSTSGAQDPDEEKRDREKCEERVDENLAQPVNPVAQLDPPLSEVNYDYWASIYEHHECPPAPQSTPKPTDTTRGDDAVEHARKEYAATKPGQWDSPPRPSRQPRNRDFTKQSSIYRDKNKHVLPYCKEQERNTTPTSSDALLPEISVELKK